MTCATCQTPIIPLFLVIRHLVETGYMAQRVTKRTPVWNYGSWPHSPDATLLKESKVKCVIFVDFEEKPATSGGYILDCSVLYAPFPSWACQWTTVACAPKPGNLANLLLHWFMERSPELRNKLDMFINYIYGTAIIHFYWCIYWQYIQIKNKNLRSSQILHTGGFRRILRRVQVR